MDISKYLKQFVFNGILINDSLKQLKEDGINIGNDIEDKISRVVENDFSPRIWNNALKMSSVYTALYCTENMIRQFITERLSERNGIDWWNICVPKKVKDEVQRLKDKESKNKYYSNRADTNIGYTMLGNLTQIIIVNWDDFSDIIPNQAWIQSRMDDLEMSRNIIMHTGVLPDIEIERIQSIVRDLLRQFG